MSLCVYRTSFNEKPKYFAYDDAGVGLKYAKKDLYSLVLSGLSSAVFQTDFTPENYRKYSHLFPMEFLE